MIDDAAMKRGSSWFTWSRIDGCKNDNDIYDNNADKHGRNGKHAYR